MRIATFVALLILATPALAANRADDGGGYGNPGSSGGQSAQLSSGNKRFIDRAVSSGSNNPMGTAGHGAAVGGTMGGIGPCGCH